MASIPSTASRAAYLYPVLEESYATQIARVCNTRDGGIGYVLRFEVETDYVSKFPVQIAGSRVHREYWVPAEELGIFNQHIVGTIEVIGRIPRQQRLAAAPG